MTIPIAPASLRTLAQRLRALAPADAAEWLRTAGADTGATLLASFTERLARRTGLEEPGQLDAHWLGPLLSEHLAEAGWGSAALVELGDEAILLDASEWGESIAGNADAPCCHFSVGALSAFFTGLAGTPVQAVEVECRGAGAAGCRFVIGSEELLAVLRDLVAAGGDWRAAIAAAHQA
jgi:hypothetical protein